MSDGRLTYRENGQVAVITIGDGTGLHENMAEFSTGISGLCENISADDNIRVVVLTGSNADSFSFEDSRIVAEASAPPFTSAERIAGIRQPVIAAVCGDAVGLGLELILACDIRITVQNARFGFPGIIEGLIPVNGGTQRLPRIIGRGKAIEMILTGDTIDADEAYRTGLVSRVVKNDDLQTTATEIAKKLAAMSPIALRYAKEAIYKGMDMTLSQGMRLESDLYFLLHTTSDRVEGITAFQEKRKPTFEGR